MAVFLIALGNHINCIERGEFWHWKQVRFLPHLFFYAQSHAMEICRKAAHGTRGVEENISPTRLHSPMQWKYAAKRRMGRAVRKNAAKIHSFKHQ